MYRKRLLIPVASISFVLLLTLALLLNVIPQETASSETSVTAGSEILESLNAAFVEVAKTAKASVVNISTVVEVRPGSRREYRPWGDPFWDDLFKRFFPEEPQRQPQRREGPRGSGFIVKEDGYILTNHHVVSDADKIKVILNDKREFDAKLIGTDEETEVAVIKVEEKGLPVASLGDSDKLQVGEWVLAVGNPFGLSHTVTNGIVSATGRSDVLGTVTYQDFIQTNAAINPGNSGGPLVNIKGQVVGINTAIALATTASGMPVRGNVGIGFAVPINMALDVMGQLIEKGKVVRGWLGIGFQRELSMDIAEKYGLKEPRGALITVVSGKGPAGEAGLEPGDLIIEFDGETVKDGEHLKKLVAGTEPGEKVKVKVIRNREQKEFEVKLGERTEEALAELGERRTIPGEAQEEWLGITVQELTDELAQRFGHEGQKGVLVSGVDPEGPAAEIDNPPSSGDLIQEIEFQEIKNMDDYRKAIKEVENKESVMIRLRRAGLGSEYIVIKRKQ